MITWIIIIAIAVVVIAIIAMYNNLVKLNVRTDEAWSDIDVQLKRRYDLIPNLVETVKGYAKHEKGVFEDVTKARAEALSAKGPADKAKAENQIEGALKSIFAVAEAYPELKANQNFAQLQTDLTDTEDKIQASRRFYNSNVRELNIAVRTFPTNIFANMFHFKIRELFELDDEAAKEPVKVDFSK
jgi:LemA protein